MHPINRASPIWTWLWLAWAVGGVATFLAIVAAIELGWQPPPRIWVWWAIPGVAGGVAIEIGALTSRSQGNTLSEHIWAMELGFRSLIVVFCLWLAWLVGFGSAWPSAGVFFLLWCAYHFALEVPDDIDERRPRRGKAHR